MHQQIAWWLRCQKLTALAPPNILNQPRRKYWQLQQRSVSCATLAEVTAASDAAAINNNMTRRPGMLLHARQTLSPTQCNAIQLLTCGCRKQTTQQHGAAKAQETSAPCQSGMIDRTGHKHAADLPHVSTAEHECTVDSLTLCLAPLLYAWACTDTHSIQ